jgi:hypothetical protein
VFTIPFFGGFGLTNLKIYDSKGDIIAGEEGEDCFSFYGLDAPKTLLDDNNCVLDTTPCSVCSDKNYQIQPAIPMPRSRSYSYSSQLFLTETISLKVPDCVKNAFVFSSETTVSGNLTESLYKPVYILNDKLFLLFNQSILSVVQPGDSGVNTVTIRTSHVINGVPCIFDTTLQTNFDFVA